MGENESGMRWEWKSEWVWGEISSVYQRFNIESVSGHISTPFFPVMYIVHSTTWNRVRTKLFTLHFISWKKFLSTLYVDRSKWQIKLRKSIGTWTNIRRKYKSKNKQRRQIKRVCLHCTRRSKDVILFRFGFYQRVKAQISELKPLSFSDFENSSKFIKS